MCYLRHILYRPTVVSCTSKPPFFKILHFYFVRVYKLIVFHTRLSTPASMQACIIVTEADWVYSTPRRLFLSPLSTVDIRHNAHHSIATPYQVI